MGRVLAWHLRDFPGVFGSCQKIAPRGSFFVWH
jgi:hypothetical protein